MLQLLVTVYQRASWVKIDLDLFTGLYKADPYGNVKNLNTNKILKPSKRGCYLSVKLRSVDKKYRNVFIHRLVYHQLVAPLGEDDTINHKDGNPLNNSVGNLEVLTAADNNIDSALRRAVNGSKTLKMTTSKRLLASEMYDEGKELVEIASYFGVTVKTIRFILAGEVWGFSGNRGYIEKMGKNKGRGDNNRKISEVDRVEIIKLALEGKSDSKIAKDYKVHRSTINRIVRLERQKVRNRG